MFKARATTCALYNTMVNDAFKDRIDGEMYAGDCSFIASMRALLHTRMGESDSVYLRQMQYRDITSENVLDRAFPSGEELDNKYFIIDLGAASDKSADIIKTLRGKFCKEHPGFEEVEKLALYFKPAKYDVVFFVNKQKRCTIVYVDRLTLNKYHMLQTGITLSTPWYFTDPSKLDLELFNITSGNGTDYLGCIEKYAEMFDLRDLAIKRSLSGYESRLYKVQLESKERTQREIMRKIDDLQNTFASLLREYDDNNTMISGLTARIGEKTEGGEIMEFFLNNKALDLISANDERMTFVVKGYLEVFDEDAAAGAINNSRGYCYMTGFSISPEKMVKLLKSIFLEHKLKIKVVAGFNFALGRNVNTISYEDNIYQSYKNNYFLHPHIARFNCLGGNTQVINTALVDGDHLGALVQCVMAAKNLNWGDSTVIRNFMENLYNEKYGACIELPDGSSVTPSQAIEWLEKEENK